MWGARYLADRVEAAGADAVLAGAGVANLSAWLGVQLAQARGCTVQLTAEIGLWGYAATPADPFVLNHRNFPTATMLSDAQTVLGALVGGPGNDDDRLPRRRADRPERERELHVDSSETFPRRIGWWQRRREHRGRVRRGRDADAGAHAGTVRLHHVAGGVGARARHGSRARSRSATVNWCSPRCRRATTHSRRGSMRHVPRAGGISSSPTVSSNCHHPVRTKSRRCAGGTPRAGSFARSLTSRWLGSCSTM